MEIDETKLKESLELFLKCDIKFDSKSSNILRLKSFTSNNLNVLFKYFCSNILNLNYISSIAKHFPELLLPIVYEVFSIDDNADHARESLYTSDALWQLHQRKCIVLSRLIHYSPAILRHSYKYFTKYPSPFDKPFLNNVQPIVKKKKHFRDSKIDGYLIDCAHSFLKSNVNFYKNQWNWSEFILNYCGEMLTDQCANNSITVKYCNEILAMLTEMTPIQRYRKFTLESLIEYDIAMKAGNISEHSILNTKDHSSRVHLINWNYSLNSFINIDGITLPIFNIENANYYKNNNNNIDERDVTSTADNIVMVKSTKSNLRNIALGISTGNAICLTGPVGCGKTSLVEYLARITGRILRKSHTDEKRSPGKINNKRKYENGNNNLVIVDELSTSTNGISNENVVLHSSAERKRENPENGIESHESRSNDDDDAADWEIPDLQKENSFLRIQLGDQTDSKMLLGQYRCTDVPGEFIWQAGVLTQAVMNGYWLLLEDLDLATQDVCTILTNLLENNYLSVSGFRDYLPITPGFQLFVTLRTPRQTNSSQQSMFQLLDKYLFTINILPLSHNELSEVICNNFPKLTTVANRIVDVYIEYSSGNHLINNDDFGDVDYLNSEMENDDDIEKNINDSNVKPLDDQNTSKRLLSTRDLMKLCKRSHSTFSVTSIECAYFVLQNAIDLFCSYLPSGQKKTEYIIKIGSKLGIVESRCVYLANEYKPVIDLNGDEIKIGRTHLNKRNTRKSRYESDQQSTRLKLGEPEPETEQLIKRKQPTFSFTRPAACILERIAVCIQHNEPILLVGETGVGKTSSVQYLAYQTNHKLCVINMNNQSDISDLIGGYKPVDVLFIITGMRNEFETLFRKTYVETANEMFFNGFSRAMHRKNYRKLIQLMLRVCDDAVKKKAILKNTIDNRIILKQWAELKLKILKLQSQLKQSVNVSFAFITGSLVNCIRNGDWVLLDEINLATTETLECLSTILEPDGSIVLLERGDYYPIERHPDFRIFACMNPNTDIGKKDLPISIRNRFTEFFIDELTVENDLLILVNDYLQNTGINKGKIVNIVKLYKTLRMASELQLNDGLGNRPIYSLRTLCRALHICRKNLCGSIERNLYESFSISFLTQLDYESYCKVTHMIQTIILTTNKKALLSHPIPKPNRMNVGSSTAAMEYIDFEGYWITQGPCPIMDCENYILTENVRTNLKNIARIISIGKLPILLQGPTSAGKTSLIEYIAQKSGNYCLRVNNHEHTDLQEYIGTYVTDLNGKLVFKEGVLVQAMRNGYWIILDELNLASSDILEALNRVLDDNRELFIPETQQLIRAHDNFMLFATQNPPGIYGGRKTLSRAFKNRFIELHFDEIPRNELEIILEKRCKIPKSLACKMVKTIGDLQLNRKHATKCTFTLRDLFRWGNRYTYADEQLLANRLYDWNQHLIDEGYLVLSSRVRNSDELELIEKVLFTNFRKHINLDNLYRLHEHTSMVTRKLLTNISDYQYHKEIVWTDNLLRMAVITGKALQFNEPVLLVGPTGCGKTTICQILADIVNRKLRILNCHMHTEGADFLGGLRPYRNENDTPQINGDHTTDNKINKSTFNKKQLFEWKNGPLIMSMQNGEYFLADEISLAEDSVLERLNCILEPERTVLLSEKGGVNGNFLNEHIQSQANDNNKRKEPNEIEIETEFIIKAKNEFQFLATMNPGGDFGKRELSPALRNRFTEIWCPETNNIKDLQKIAKHSLLFIGDLNLNNMDDKFERLSFIIVDTIMFIKEKIEKFNYSIRDILAWVSYIIINYKRERVMMDVDVGVLVDADDDIKSLCNIMLYGLEIIFLDALEMLQYTDDEILLNRLMISNYFLTIFNQQFMINILYGNIRSTESTKCITMANNKYGINPFYILTNPNVTVSLNEINDFSFGAQTTLQNLFRLLSALTLKKPILLEGPPGVGKTSLIENLAKQIGYKIVRINLCEHTDLTDLFGSDLPADDDLMLKLNKIDDDDDDEQGKVNDKKTPILGSFVWRDGPLLSAIKTPHTWILLDELNLAPQSVLEGLNAILDHRGEVYIPELNKTFSLGQDTRIFASQNPLRQGGGRKGLPQSFLNRFTKVYLTKLQSIDFTFVVHDMYNWYIEKLQEFFNVRSVADKEEEVVEEHHQQFNEIQNLINNLFSKMIAFSSDLDKGIHNLEFGYEGGPFEVNLRDILRWCDFVSDNNSGFVPFLNGDKIISNEKHIERFLHDFMLIIYEKMKLVYCERMRNDLDKNYINEIFSKHFHYPIERLIQESQDYSLYWTDKYIYVNNLKLSKMEIQNASEQLNFKHSSSILLASQRNTIHSLMDCILMSKPVILCGPSDCGKTKSIHLACSILNRSCNVDTIDDTVTGSFQQIDFNRHLEVIARQIEGKVNHIIKSLLLQQTFDKLVIDNITKLFQSWENYKKLLNKDYKIIQQNAMSKELILFNKKLLSLEHVIELLLATNKICNVIEIHTIQTLKIQIKNLTTIIQNRETLNTGGSFEWIDSVFVKSMKNGEYISLEHVNLCSSAILDRLNSVFEPNGQLLISEKGVVIDNDAIDGNTNNNSAEIVGKHKEFRAFLTLDPKHGEISRAMRNRCIELYLKRDRYTEDDLKQLLYENGLVETFLIDGLYNIHKRVQAIASDYNQFGISHLIKCGFLISENLRKTNNNMMNVNQAIRQSCHQVYVYSSTIDYLGFGLKYYHQQLKKEIQNGINDIQFYRNVANYKNIILNGKELNGIALVRYQCEPFLTFMRCSQQMETVNFVLGNLFSAFKTFDFSNMMDDYKILLYTLFDMSTFRDFKQRATYLRHMLNEIPEMENNCNGIFKLIDKLSNKLDGFLLNSANNIEAEFDDDRKAIPWNNKLFPRLRDYNQLNGLNYDWNSTVLKLSSHLLGTSLLNDFDIEQSTKFSDLITYSRAIHEQLIINSNNSELINVLFHYVQELRLLIDAVIQSDSIAIQNYQEFIKLMLSLLWCNRLVKASQVKLYNKPQWNDILLKQIWLHVRWTHKYISIYYRTLTNEFDEKLQILSGLYETMEKSVFIHYDNPLNGIRKFYTKQYLNYLPNITNLQATTNTLIYTVHDMLFKFITEYHQNNLNPTEINRKFLTLFNTNLDVDIIKEKLLQLNLDTNLFVYFKMIADNSNIFGDAKMMIPKSINNAIGLYERGAVNEMLNEIDIVSKVIYANENMIKNAEESSDDIKHIKFTIDQLPILEYFTMKILNCLQCKLTGTPLSADDDDTEITEINENYFKNIKTLPIEILSIIKLTNTDLFKVCKNYWNKPKENKVFSSLLFNINSTIQTFNLTSLSTNYSLCYRNDTIQNQLSKLIDDQESIYSSHYNPLLTMIATKILYQTQSTSSSTGGGAVGGDIKLINLGDLNKWKHLSNSLQHLLWMNCGLFQMKYNFEMLNYQFVLDYSKNLVNELEIIKEFKIQHEREQLENQQQQQQYSNQFNTIQFEFDRLVNKFTDYSNALTIQQKPSNCNAAILQCLIGAIELNLKIYVPLISPKEKNQLKRLYKRDDIKLINSLLKSYEFMKISLNYEQYGNEIVNELNSELSTQNYLMNNIQKKIGLYGNEIQLLPDKLVEEQEEYNVLVHTINDFLFEYCHPKKLLELIENAEKCFDISYGSSNDDDDDDDHQPSSTTNDILFKMLNDTMKRIDSWVQSSVSLQHDLRKYFINFKEFMHPIENAITTFKYGLNGIRYYLKKQYDKMKLKINQTATATTDDVDKFELIIKNLIEFPSLNGLNLIGIHQTINQIFTNDSVNLLLLFKSKLYEIKNSLIIRKEFNSIIYNDFNKLIKIFNRLWIHQEDVRRLHKIDESSLYVKKKRNINQNNINTNSNVDANDDNGDDDDDDIVNEKQLQKSIEKIFPNYVKNDFNDFMMTSNDHLNTNNDLNFVKEKFQHEEEDEEEEEKQRLKEEQLSSIDNLLNDNDVKFLCDIFCMCMSKYTKSTYYDPKKLNEILQQFKYQTQNLYNESDQLNYTDVYYQNSLLFQKFLNKCNQCLNTSIDDNYFNGISLICYMTQLKNCTNSIDEVTPNELKVSKQYNFYKDSNVTEIHECTNILDVIEERVHFELQEWPDHAALNDISKVIQRIRTLPITSALARFSTGFQLLREKIDGWNKVSHHKNHLKEEELKVAEHIHRWTKLELQSWRECLSQVNQKVQLKAYKLFFYVFDAVTECLQNKTNELLNERSIASPEPECTMANDNEHEIGLIDTLNQFLESASYGDFAIRLKIIKSFEQYLGHMHDNDLIREQMGNYRIFLISIFYNIHLYFSQFTNEIDECIKTIRQPIEKKLKEFVRIESYNKDISYFSMNADISRIHRHLHKFLKEFEKGLKQSVNQLFQYKESQTTAALDLNLTNEKGMNLRHQSKSNYYMMDAKNYILSELYQKKIMQRKSLTKLTYPTTITLLIRIDKLFYTSRVICHDAIRNARFPVLIYALQNLLMEQTERLDDLRKLEVDRGQVRAKQKVQAKNILQQKRKGLSDFYKILTTLGINYRTGLMEQTIQKHLINIKIKPFSIPLLVNVNHTSIALKSKHKNIDHKLLYLNENLDLYYSKCVFRLKLLQNILLKPNEALGLRNMERIKGYAVDMFLLVQTQRETISNSYNEMHCLKEQIQCLLNLDDCMKITTETADKNGDDENNNFDFIQLRKKYIQIKENLFKIYNVFEQYKLLLKCIPDANEDLCVVTHNRFSLYKNSEKYNRIDKFIRNILNAVKLQLNDLEKLDDMKFFNFKIINEFKMKYDGIQNDMKLLSNEFLLSTEGLNDKSDNDHSNTKKNEYLIIGNGLLELLTELNLNSINSFSCTSNNVNEKHFDLNQQQNDMHNVDMELENIVHKILYSMQTLYKKYPKQNKNDSLTKTLINNSKESNLGNDDDDLDNDDHEHNILENHLKSHITKELQYDLEILNITEICKKLQNILLIIEYDGSQNLQQKTIIEKAIKLLPILQQFHLLCKYYLIQQIGAHKVSVKVLSTMLIIFLELGKNGFCIPPDLMQKEDDEDGDEGKTEGEQKKEGGGFGSDDNGTGEKDVSDKIESEDQLDTAKKPGSEEKKEEKNEDADCKEEKGIDMSEDFDSKLQDVEKRDEDDSDTNESDSDDEEKDLDKEMGETEPGADKLDDQIWGSDDEKDPDESDEDENDMNDEEDGDGSKEENDSHNNLDAQNDKQKKTNPDDSDIETEGLDATNDENDKNKREKQKDIDQFKEPEYDEEQVNNKHNELEEPPEPEDMNIEDMVNLDNDDGRNDKDENNEENPFDIDRMKEQIDPNADGDENEEENAEDNQTDKDNDEQNPNDVESSDDEGQLEFDRKNNETEEITEEDTNDKDNDKNEQLEGNVDEDGADDDGDDKDENEDKTDEEKKSKTDENEYHESKDKKSKEENIQAMPDQQNKGSTDQVQNNEEQQQTDEIKQKDEMDTQDTGEDQQAVGQAENEKSKSGHQGIAKDTKESKRSEQDRRKVNEQKEKRTKGHTNEERTISDAKENKTKQLKTIDKLNTDKNDDQQLDENPKLDDDQMDENENASEEHQHVKDAKRSDKTTLDNATEEQSKQIRHEDQTQNMDDENNDEDQSVELPPSDTEPDDIEILDDKDVELLESEKTEQKSEKKSSKTDRTQEQCDINKEQIDVEGDIIDTHRVLRGNETRAHCIAEILQDKSFAEEPTAIEALELRKLYEKEKMSQKLSHPQSEHFELWQSISNRMLSNARELCEQLRLILEPTKCTRLKGDYRTGRRINMKKIIPYIASQFRKDKIWLRRTKPAQRDYKITIAIDDSKSMDHNNSKELTLQAISLVSQALTLLESGKLSVISFGESTQILLNYFDQFNGPKLVQSLMFNQNKTCIAGLLDFIRTANTEESYCGIDNGIFENLLLILSDGRNIFSEGIQRVKNSVKLARLQRIFIVYIIIDNPENEHSILDIQTPTFSTDGKVLTMKSYMDTFPFPYYVIVRDLAQLPLVLSDAMRQWFELVNSE